MTEQQGMILFFTWFVLGLSVFFWVAFSRPGADRCPCGGRLRKVRQSGRVASVVARAIGDEFRDEARIKTLEVLKRYDIFECDKCGFGYLQDKK